MWGAQADNAPQDCTTLAGMSHTQCAAENADVQLGKILDAVEAVDAAKGGHTLVVLTADHGATYGEHFYGKKTADAGNSNWYYAPPALGVWDAGTAGALDKVTYSNPSPDIAEAQRRQQRAVLLPVDRDRGLAARPLARRRARRGRSRCSSARRHRDVLAPRAPLPAPGHQQDDQVGEGLVDGSRPGDRRHDGGPTTVPTWSGWCTTGPVTACTATTAARRSQCSGCRWCSGRRACGRTRPVSRSGRRTCCPPSSRRWASRDERDGRPGALAGR